MADRPILSRLRRLAVRASVATVMTSGLVLAAGSPAAHAATPDQMVCTAGGAITIVHHADNTYGWVLSGVGACTVPNHPAQARQVTLVGTATTSNLGLCSNSVLIDPFAMHITATFVSVSSTTQGLATTVQEQSWALPATTFPIASPFAVTDAGGSTIGLGEFETHIFAQCPPDGQPTMQVNWVQSV